MMKQQSSAPKRGRPIAGTEQLRLTQLLDQALEIFMRDGYANTSIAIIAKHCNVSTRTIYEQFENKQGLMIAAVKQLVDRDVIAMQAPIMSADMALEDVLIEIGRFILKRVMEPRMVSFFRIGISEVSRHPELALLMRQNGPERIHQLLADIFARFAERELLAKIDYVKAGEAFCEMLIAGPRTKALFGILENNWNQEAHLQFMVRLFLHGLKSSSLSDSKIQTNNTKGHKREKL